MKKVKQINGEHLFSLILFLVGLIWTINGIQLGIWAGTTPDSGLFPLVIGVMLATLALCNFIKQLKDSSNNKKLGVREKKVILLYICGAVICALAINILGMFAMLAVGLILWFKIMGKYSWGKGLLITAGMLAALYGVFVLWLRVPFPSFLGLF